MNKVLALIVGLILCPFFLSAQDDDEGAGMVAINIPEVAIMDLESNTGTSISLVAEIPSDAGRGLDLTAATDSSIWLNYSSVRTRPEESNRSIYARITNGSVPSGLRLRVRAKTYSGNGDGSLGIPNATGRILNANDKRVVRQIKTCYTGDGAGNGHQLVYSLEFRNNQYSNIDFDDSGSVTVLYTITDN